MSSHSRTNAGAADPEISHAGQSGSRLDSCHSTPLDTRCSRTSPATPFAPPPARPHTPLMAIDQRTPYSIPEVPHHPEAARHPARCAQFRRPRRFAPPPAPRECKSIMTRICHAARHSGTPSEVSNSAPRTSRATHPPRQSFGKNVCGSIRLGHQLDRSLVSSRQTVVQLKNKTLTSQTWR